MHNPIYDAIGQEIQVGSFVLMANGCYVKQNFGVVTKLGNKGNAKVGHSFVDATGLVVVDGLLNDMDAGTHRTFKQLYDSAKEKFDYSRPNSGSAPRFKIYVDKTGGRGWVYDAKDHDITLTKHNLRRVVRCVEGFRRSKIVPGKYQLGMYQALNRVEMPMKVVCELGLENYIGDDAGFDLTILPDSVNMQ